MTKKKEKRLFVIVNGLPLIISKNGVRIANDKEFPHIKPKYYFLSKMKKKLKKVV